MIDVTKPTKRRRSPVGNIEVRVNIVPVKAGTEAAKRFDEGLLILMRWGAEAIAARKVGAA